METFKHWLFDNNDNKTMLSWLKMRCEIQCGPNAESDAEALLKEFCTEYDNDHQDLKDKTDDKKAKEEFQNFLAQHEPEDDIWGNAIETANAFIGKVNAYRRDGIQDSDLENEVMSHAKYINNDPLRYVYELIQNADDCDYEIDSPEMCIEIDDKGMTVSYPEKGMTWSDILAITTIGRSNKGKKKKHKRIIGEKGRGFKTIYSVCDSATIRSGFYSFVLRDNSLKPEWVDPEESERYEGTKMVLSFKDQIDVKDQNSAKNKLKEGNKVFDEIIKK